MFIPNARYLAKSPFFPLLSAKIIYNLKVFAIFSAWITLPFHSWVVSVVICFSLFFQAAHLLWFYRIFKCEVATVFHRNQKDKLEHKTVPHFHLKINTFLCLPCKVFWPVLCPTCTCSSQSLCETQTILLLSLKKTKWKPVHRFWHILTVKWVSIYGTAWSLIFKSYLCFQRILFFSITLAWK